MKNLIAIFLSAILLLPLSFISADQKSRLSIMTYVSNNEQERGVKALIKSIRELCGDYKNSEIYVVLGDKETFPAENLKGKGVHLIPLEIGRQYVDYPLAIKAFAAAQIEDIVKGKVETLVWFDPGVIVLNKLDLLSLDQKYDAVMRPVSLLNTIGIAPGAEPNEYWKPIYKEANINYKNLYTMRTVVDEAEIQPYYNCEVYSINPNIGICAEWRRLMTRFLQDEEYQKTACTAFQKRLFLHQALLSSVIVSKINKDRIKELPITYGYPFNQHDRLRPAKKAASLNELSVVIFDYAWDRIPSWMKMIPVEGNLKDFLSDLYRDYLKLADKIYRIEGSCNSFIVITKQGSVLIDPAGATAVPEYFKKTLEKYPLKAILLTHAHQDHSDDISKWKGKAKIPVIAQREYKNYFRYQSEFAGFFARRNAIWSRKPLPAEIVNKPNSANEPAIYFSDNYNYKLGGITFKMIHTPGETPDHTTIYIPELSAVFVGDNYYEYFINNSTFRGTMIRPIKGYITALDTALSFKPRYFLMGHGAPIIGERYVKETAGNLRDALKYLYKETVKGINEGKDVYTLMQTIKVPEKFNVAPYHGKVEWTIRGIYQEYVGWFDENPSTMYEIPASSIYGEIVDAAGIDALLKKCRNLIDKKEYIKVLHLTDILLKTEPDNKTTAEIRLKALEGLKSGTYNFIEKIWLDYGISETKKILK